ncbi:MAG TPA: PAS domain S-box protein, partial [Polyangiaceae bacterium]|nr:PAS domain S-box protein [Polyangiaceae bacterium]
WPALVASVLGVLCLNYFFLPPLYTLTIEDPKNWVALGAFFITALTAGGLSAWARRQATEAEASRSQARLASTYNRSLLEASLDPLLTVARDGKINDVNAAAETLTGETRAALIGTEFSQHFTEREKAQAACERVFRAGTVRGWALELRNRRGYSTSVLFDGSLYRDADGHVIGVVAAARPVGTYSGRVAEMSPDPRFVRRLRLFVMLASACSIGFGLLSIIHPKFQSTLLRSSLPGRSGSELRTSACLVLLGFALGLARQTDAPAQSKLAPRCAAILGVVSALVGLGGLTAHALGRERVMSPLAASCVCLLGLAFPLLDRPLSIASRRHWLALHLAGASAILAILGFLDSLFSPHLLQASTTPQSALALLVLSVGLLGSRTDRGLAALPVSTTPNAAFTRWLLPAVVGIPLLIATSISYVLSRGGHSVNGALSLMAMAMTLLPLGVVVWNSSVLHRSALERRRAEEALHDRELELREVERLGQLGSWWWAPKADSVIWSPGLSHLTGRDPMLPPPTYSEHLGFHTPDSSARLAAAVQRALRSGAAFELDLEMLRTDGEHRSVTVRGEAVRDAAGEVLVVRASVDDITERRQAEAALERSARENAQLAAIVEHSDDAIISKALDQRILTWNRGAERMFLYTPAEAIGQPISLIVPLEKLAELRDAMNRVIRGDGTEHLETRRVRKDGRRIDVSVTISPILDAEGGVVAAASISRDITERKRAESQIRLLALHQAVVAELGLQALRQDPFGKVLDDAVARLAEILTVDYTRVLELLPDGQTLLLRAGVGWKPGVIGNATMPLELDSQAAFTLTSQAPVLLEDLRTEQRFHHVPMFGDPGTVVSGMSTVIATSAGPYGILGVHTREPRHFTSDELHALQAVANILGTILERRQAEQELRQIQRAHRALSTGNEALVRATEEDVLLHDICQIVVTEAGYRFSWVGRAEQDPTQSVRPVAYAGVEEGYLKTLNVTWADSERGRGPTGTCIRMRETVVAKNIATDARMLPWRAAALDRGYGSSVSIPLIVDDAVFGALMIYAAEPDAFGAEEVRLLSELAHDLAFGIEALRTRRAREQAETEIRALNAELEQRVTARTAQLHAANEELGQAREREIALGFKIQQTLLLDTPPEVPAFRLAALTVPSQRIDGDFYMFLRHSD